MRNSISFTRGLPFCQPEACKTAFSAEALAKLKFRKSSIAAKNRDGELVGCLDRLVAGASETSTRGDAASAKPDARPRALSAQGAETATNRRRGA